MRFEIYHVRRFFGVLDLMKIYPDFGTSVKKVFHSTLFPDGTAIPS
jgi:hypothetical protein